ncbi:phosphodiester glycosidase family protein [Kitasatospora sp. NPDC002040]|uniref:phosphodiester glycosidase family protein n=1 Tax=Kitasatospora sp. NPDC002040 TaxID=3154661 RepID=UPI0033219547
MKHTAKRGAVALAVAASVVAVPVSAPQAVAAPTGLTLALLESGATVKTVDLSAPGIVRTAYAGGSQGPWIVNVVVIDPNEAPLALKGAFGTGLATSETTSAMHDGVSVNALRRPRVGVNASFFDGAMKNPGTNTFDGDVGGVLVSGGKLLSEAAKGKGAKPVGSALVLQHGRLYITELSTALTVRPKNSAVPARQLDGINRVPGRNAHCEGRESGETIVDGTCFDLSEIISFTPEYGGPTPTTAYTVEANDPDKPGGKIQGPISADEGIELDLDADNVVTACYDSAPAVGSTCEKSNRGGRTVRAGHRILQGIGDAAGWLRTNAPKGTGLELPETVTDTRFGDQLALDPSMYVSPGGDLLLRNGAVSYTQPAGTPAAEPRTAVGTDGFGRTVLVTVDGRDAVSKGATLLELAVLMQDLGVIDALNMDGGGSTTLVWQGQVVNHPSDGAEVERKVADTVYAGVGGYPLP